MITCTSRCLQGQEQRGRHLRSPLSGKSSPKLRLHCQRKATVFRFFSLSFSLFSFIVLTMLGTNIKLNIYSIQTMKALTKQRTRTKQKLLQLISKTSLYHWTAFWPWNPYFSGLDLQAHYCLLLNWDGKNFEWRIRDGGQCFLILKISKHKRWGMEVAFLLLILMNISMVK